MGSKRCLSPTMNCFQSMFAKFIVCSFNVVSYLNHLIGRKFCYPLLLYSYDSFKFSTHTCSPSYLTNSMNSEILILSGVIAQSYDFFLEELVELQTSTRVLAHLFRFVHIHQSLHTFSSIFNTFHMIIFLFYLLLQ